MISVLTAGAIIPNNNCAKILCKCLKELCKRIRGVSTNITYSSAIADEYITYFAENNVGKSVVDICVLCLINFVVHQEMLTVITSAEVFFQYLVKTIDNYTKGIPSKYLQTKYLEGINGNVQDEEVTFDRIIPFVLEYLPITSIFKLRLVCKRFTSGNYNYAKWCHIKSHQIENIKGSFLEAQTEKYDKSVNVSIKNSSDFVQLAQLKLLGGIDTLNISHVRDEKTLNNILLCQDLQKINYDFSNWNVETLLKRNRNSMTIKLKSITLSRIHTLNLSRCSISEISFLQGTTINTIILDDNRISDVIVFAHRCENISMCTNKTCGTSVKVLSLQKNCIEDISPFSKNTSIVHLNLSYNRLLGDQALENKTIKYLGLKGTNFRKLDDLKGTDIQELDFSENSGIHHFQGLPSLKKLTARYCVINIISHFENLHTVDLHGAHVGDIKGLVHICGDSTYCAKKPCNTSLHTLILDQEDINEEFDVSFLEGSTVHTLSLANMDVVNLSVISDNNRLKKLDLHNTTVNNIDWLINNTSIEELNLNMTEVKDIHPITKTAVKKLKISNTRVQDISPIVNSKVQFLNIEGCCIKDLSALSNIERMIIVKCNLQSSCENVIVRKHVYKKKCVREYCENLSTDHLFCCEKYFCKDHISEVVLEACCVSHDCKLGKYLICEYCAINRGYKCSICKTNFCDKHNKHKCVPKNVDKELDESLILSLIPKQSRLPAFKNQTVIHKNGVVKLDKDNCIILQNKALSSELSEYIKGASKVRRKSGKSAYGSTKPRKEVCYTTDGEPYSYSKISHYTVKYPEHVKKIVPSLLDIVSKYFPDNPYVELSNAVDILYSPEFKRGGSISAHSDDEDDWGLVIVFSLGQTRWLRVQRKSDEERFNVEMQHNSVVMMYGETFQKLYIHQVDKLSSTEKVGARLSLNIRFKKR